MDENVNADTTKTNYLCRCAAAAAATLNACNACEPKKTTMHCHSSNGKYFGQKGSFIPPNDAKLFAICVYSV